MRAAIIENNVVVNVIVVDDDTPLEDYNAIPCHLDVGVGWTYLMGTFSPPDVAIDFF